MKKALLFTAGTLILIISVFVFRFLGINELAYSLNYLVPSGERPDSVAIVGIDIKSIEQYGSWPWNRTTISRLMRAIQSVSPRAVAPDVLFLRRNDSGGSDSLAKAFSEISNLVLPFRIHSFATTSSNSAAGVPVPIYKYRFIDIRDRSSLEDALLYKAAEITSADTLFTQHARYGGFVNISTKRTSQKVTEAIHVMRVGTEYFPSFGLSAAAAFLNIGHTDITLKKGPSVTIGAHTVPLSSFAGSAFINYRGRTGTVPTISAADVLNGSADVAELSNKLVFVGVTEPGIVQDFFTTPVGPDFPGVEIWATVASDLLQGSWVRYGGGIPGAINWIIMFAIFPGLALVFPYRKRMTALGIATGTVVASFIAGVVFFRLTNYFWNPLGHSSAWVLSLVWLSLQKADPHLTSEALIDFEPRASAKSGTLPPATREDYIRDIPDVESAQHVLSKLPEGSSPSPEASAIEVSDATMVEAAIAPPNPSTPPAGSRIEAFSHLCNGHIIRLLGSGGMADVYLIWNPRMEVYRAVKVLKPGQPERFTTRFETEIRIAAGLTHPNIVQCFSVGDWYGLPFIEMEYIHGASFEDFLIKKRALSPAETCAVGILVCRALRYAHKEVVSIYGKTYNGVIHRDLKPANIMLSKAGTIKLTDFGIARPSEVSLHTVDSGTIVGTLPYLAPEQAEAGQVTARSDVYALGVTLYEFLTGERAFPQTEMTSLLTAKVSGTTKPLTPGPLAPEPLVEVINRAISRDPNGRFADAAEMEHGLKKAFTSVADQPGYAVIDGITNRFWG